MFGSFLSSSGIASFQDLATVGACSICVSCFTVSCFAVSCVVVSVVGFVVSATGTVSCVICSCDIVIYLLCYHSGALIL